MDTTECGLNAPSKINYPHGEFGLPCFELAVVALKESCAFSHLKLHAVQQINRLNVSQCFRLQTGHQQ